jgi:hypothetical protein
MASKFNDTDIITLLTDINPKNILANGTPAKARQRFDLYRTGMSVAAYKAAVRNHPAGGKNYAATDLIWDTLHGFIKVGAPTNVGRDTSKDGSGSNASEVDEPGYTGPVPYVPDEYKEQPAKPAKPKRQRKGK